MTVSKVGTHALSAPKHESPILSWAAGNTPGEVCRAAERWQNEEPEALLAATAKLSRALAGAVDAEAPVLKQLCDQATAAPG